MEDTDFNRIETYLLSWDCTGLESVICISQMERDETWKALTQVYHQESDTGGRSSTVNSIVQSIMLRAKFNTQRFYEIYLINVDSSIDEKSLRTMFDMAPQQTVDLIRKQGQKLYSDRPKKDYFKIT